jgi:hypothetical protein
MRPFPVVTRPLPHVELPCVFDPIHVPGQARELCLPRTHFLRMRAHSWTFCRVNSKQRKTDSHQTDTSEYPWRDRGTARRLVGPCFGPKVRMLADMVTRTVLTAFIRGYHGCKSTA